MMVEAQGCPGLVSKMWGQVTRGANPLEQQSLGPGPNKARILEKGLGGKAQGVTQKIPVGTSRGGIT